MLTGTLFDIQRLSIHDGPGIRTCVFFKGCNLSCKWCHNPEGQKKYPELRFIKSKCINCGDCIYNCVHSKNGSSAVFTEDCEMCGKCADNCYSGALSIVGKSYNTDEVMAEILQDRSMFDISGGGVTFTGGEPLLQSDFLLCLLKICKAEKINTAIETALCVETEILDKLIPYTDLFICDIKSFDSNTHLLYTGQRNELIIKNITYLSNSNANILLRTPIIPGVNDDENSIRNIKSFIKTLKGEYKWELLPFHNMCSEKYPSVGKSWLMQNTDVPSKQKMDELKKIANNY